MENQRLATTRSRLYEAALKGDVPSLLNLLQEDSLILDRCIIEKSGQFMQSPLHVAVKLGHLDFVTEILQRKPELAEELDQSNRSSPLHLASAKGHLEIVKALLVKCPDMCFVRDRDGSNPVHVAAMKGNVDVLKVLFDQDNPQAVWERTKGGETVLHLCVKHIQPWALEYLLNVMHEAQLVNSKNCDGNTVLHLAVASKQLQMVDYILRTKKIDINAVNINGFTAMDILNQRNQSATKNSVDEEIRRSLKTAKALSAKPALRQNRSRSWLNKQRSALMVVASLIATMSFQVGINPPGGVWQDSKSTNYDSQNNQFAAASSGSSKDNHDAGSSIMSTTGGHLTLNRFLISNTIGMFSSLSVIILLISGLPCKRRLFVGTLMVTMWIAVSAIAYTYLISTVHVMHTLTNSAKLAFELSVFGWMILMAILLVAHAGRFIVKMIKKLKRCWITLQNMSFTRATSHPPDMI